MSVFLVHCVANNQTKDKPSCYFLFLVSWCVSVYNIHHITLGLFQKNFVINQCFNFVMEKRHEKRLQYVCISYLSLCNVHLYLYFT